MVDTELINDIAEMLVMICKNRIWRSSSKYISSVMFV